MLTPPTIPAIRAISSDDLPSIVTHLESGGIVIYPTDTCYGVGCLARPGAPFSEIALLKQRPNEKLFPFLFPSWEAIEPLTSLASEQVAKLIQTFWPGQLTLVIPLRESARARLGVEPHYRSMAVRVSGHPFCQRLMRTLSDPLVSTSANRSGEPPIETKQEAEAAFLTTTADLQTKLLFVQENAPQNSSEAPSTVLDCTQIPFRILREGAISQEVLRSFLQ